jgi:hypothetical protein
MDKASRFALAVFSVCLMAGPVRADVGKRQELPPPAPLDVSMEEAKVEIHIKKQEGKTAEFCFLNQCSSIMADVESAFVLGRPPSINNAANEYRIYFPVSYLFGPSSPNIHKFEVLVDGAMPHSEVQAFPEPAHSEWPIVDEESRHQTQDGFSWPVRFAPGRAHQIAVRYSLALPEGEVDEKTQFTRNDKGEPVYSDTAKYIDDGKAHFTYFLRSVAFWQAPFGKELVHVVADKGLKLEIVSPKNLKPKAANANEILWEIADIRPDEDIKLTISSDTPIQ